MLYFFMEIEDPSSWSFAWLVQSFHTLSSILISPSTTNEFSNIPRAVKTADTHMNVPMTHVQQVESILLVATSTRHCCTTCEFQVHFNCNRITSSWYNSVPHQTHYSRQTQKLMNTWQNYLFVYIYIHFVIYSNNGLVQNYTCKIKTNHI